MSSSPTIPGAATDEEVTVSPGAQLKEEPSATVSPLTPPACTFPIEDKPGCRKLQEKCKSQCTSQSEQAVLPSCEPITRDFSLFKQSKDEAVMRDRREDTQQSEDDKILLLKNEIHSRDIRIRLLSEEIKMAKYREDRRQQQLAFLKTQLFSKSKRLSCERPATERLQKQVACLKFQFEAAEDASSELKGAVRNIERQENEIERLGREVAVRNKIIGDIQESNRTKWQLLSQLNKKNSELQMKNINLSQSYASVEQQNWKFRTDNMELRSSLKRMQSRNTFLLSNEKNYQVRLSNLEDQLSEMSEHAVGETDEIKDTRGNGLGEDVALDYSIQRFSQQVPEITKVKSPVSASGRTQKIKQETRPRIPSPPTKTVLGRVLNPYSQPFYPHRINTDKKETGKSNRLSYQYTKWYDKYQEDRNKLVVEELEPWHVPEPAALNDQVRNVLCQKLFQRS